MTHLENQTIKGFTWKLLMAIISSTCIMVSGGTAAYYGIKAEIKNNAAIQDSKWAVREEQYRTEKARQDKTEEIVSNHENRITTVESKSNN